VPGNQILLDTGTLARQKAKEHRLGVLCPPHRRPGTKVTRIVCIHQSKQKLPVDRQVGGQQERPSAAAEQLSQIL
jgi:hypothetical protein